MNLFILNLEKNNYEAPAPNVMAQKQIVLKMRENLSEIVRIQTNLPKFDTS